MPGLLETPPAQEAPSPMETEQSSKGDDAQSAKDSPKNEAPASRSVVGIIYPPPEVRNIVDKTADFVARNGLVFEERIKLNEANNTKFNFLNKHDPYHAYYEHKIKEIKEGVAQEQAAAQQLGYIPPPKTAAPTPLMVLDLELPRDPPPEYEFIVEPPSISATELDIVKLTAQFVARNGANFLDKLMMREQRNYQFDFLRKQHPLFTYFTKLVEQYSKVLLPAYNTLPNLQQDVDNPAGLLEKSQNRMLWEQHQRKQRQRAEEEEEKKRVEYAQIDWHDFIIVESINFRENEAGYLPPPIRPSQLANRLMQQSKFDHLADDTGDVQEIEMELEEQEAPEPPPPKPAEPKPPKPPMHPKGPIQVRRDYNPKAPHAPQQETSQYLISPITGEKIPAEKMEEHMRYGLQDPRYTEEKKKQIAEKKTKEEVFAEGVQIGSNLKLLAERRTDIFGMEETFIGQKIGEEEVPKAPTIQWDGHSGSADSAHREAQANIGEQLKVIQKAKEKAEKEQVGPTSILKTPINAAPPAHPPFKPPQPPAPPPSSAPPRPPLPPAPPQQPMNHPPPARPPMPHPVGGEMRPLLQMMPPQMQHGGPSHMMPHGGMMPMNMMPFNFPPPHGPPGMGPPFKRPHLDSEDLIPEQEFTNAHPGPVTFRVQIPSLPERSEWKLQGQVLSITLPITDPVSVIKAKISDELGMPSGKQKLQMGAVFIKDSLSLAYYNFTSTTVVQLGLKERGGRKK